MPPRGFKTAPRQVASSHWEDHTSCCGVWRPPGWGHLLSAKYNTKSMSMLRGRLVNREKSLAHV